jgi:uncharacterized damage-inducible protein DinB
VNELLRDAFDHDVWANRELLAYCRRLSDEELAATAVGAYGSVHATLDHILDAEAWYAWLIGFTDLMWWDEPDDPLPDLDEQERRCRALAETWWRFLEEPIDPDRVIGFADDDGTYDVTLGVLIAQLLNHGNEHRDQVNVILTSLGRETPNLDGWSYGEATGRGGPRS